MNKKMIPIVALTGLLLTSCGTSAWSWENATSDGALKYCLLIGQTDHNDSAARTAGIRDALKTRTSDKSLNPNTENPVEGKLKIGTKEFKTQELEHAEQKNTAGATWDSQTATSTAETWINKHGNDIDFFVSNNDGMAEGAIGATNWIEGMPIFGYDSNASTLTKINEGKIMGTINQNASAQAAGIFMLTRNCLDGLATDKVYTEGFSIASSKGYGKISSKYNFHADDKSMLVDNFAITKDNVASYLNKSSRDLVDANVTTGTTASKKVWMNYYSATDTFLNSNMKPLFAEYKSKFNFEVTEQAGDGNDEKSVKDVLATAEGYDAYVLNMVKTVNTKDYLDVIATKTGATSTNPTSTPVIFWNRQGTKADGTVDQANMKDARFKYVYYVGFDANQGGQLQGKMIVDWLSAQK